MGTGPHARRAAALVADSRRYDEFVVAYDDDLEFYSKLRNAAQEVLSFEEYVDLRRVFLERGPTTAVRDRIEDRVDRSIKNMILGRSPRGRAYAARTLDDAADRLAGFERLPVETPSLSAVVRTTVEHLYDDTDGPAVRREVLDRLLESTPADRPAAVRFVVHAALVETLHALSDEETVDRAVKTYRSVLPDPMPEDDRSASTLVADARGRRFEDDRKERALAAALCRGGSTHVAFEYLYVVAHEVVEGFRHGGDPRRADVLVARRSLDLLGERPNATDDPEATVEAYSHVARAIEHGSGRWLSDRASWPDPDWETVVNAYARAAAAIREVDPGRFVKYLSKAFRHAAHDVEDWQHRRGVHRGARDVFAAVDADDRLAETVEGTVLNHRCREREAAAHVHFENGAYEEAARAAGDAQRLAERVPQESVHLDGVELIEVLATARAAEERGEYERARHRYASHADRSERAARREALAGVKEALVHEDYRVAMARASEAFADTSLVVAATGAAAGVVPDADGPLSLRSDLVGVTDQTEAALTAAVRVHAADGAGGDELRKVVEGLFLRL